MMAPTTGRPGLNPSPGQGKLWGSEPAERITFCLILSIPISKLKISHRMKAKMFKHFPSTSTEVLVPGLWFTPAGLHCTAGAAAFGFPSSISHATSCLSPSQSSSTRPNTGSQPEHPLPPRSAEPHLGPPQLPQAGRRLCQVQTRFQTVATNAGLSAGMESCPPFLTLASCCCGPGEAAVTAQLAGLLQPSGCHSCQAERKRANF